VPSVDLADEEDELLGAPGKRPHLDPREDEEEQDEDAVLRALLWACARAVLL